MILFKAHTRPFSVLVGCSVTQGNWAAKIDYIIFVVVAFKGGRGVIIFFVSCHSACDKAQGGGGSKNNEEKKRHVQGDKTCSNAMQ